MGEEAQSKKWKSTWELTPKEIEKKEKKIKKRRKWERALGLPSSSSNKSSEILKHVATVNPTRISYESSRKSNSTMSTMTNGHHQDISEDIPEEDQANGTVSAPPVKPPKKSKKHQIETPTPLPPPPPWKIILETTVNTGIDSLFKFMIDNDTFFDIVTKKRYDEVASFTVTPWALPAKGPEDEDEVAEAASSRLSSDGGVVKEQRTMFYQFVQTIAFSRTTIAVEQLMTKTLSNVGHSYIVDCQAQASGAPMADSCVQHLHYRFEDASAGGEANTATRFTVLADIEWVKPCLFKGRVESETWSGMKKYYEIVELEIQDLHAQSFRPVPPNPPIQAEEQQRAESKPRKKKDAPGAPTAGTRQSQALVGGGGGRGLTGETQQPQQQQSTATMVGLTLVVLFVLTTMCAITFAMFKMTGTVELLSERVLMLENTINELKETAANRGHPDNYCHNPDTSDM